MQIREAKMEDIEAIVNLIRPMWIEHAEHEKNILSVNYISNYDAVAYVQKFIEKESSEFFVAEIENAIIGCIRGEIVEMEGMFLLDKCVYVDDLVVREVYRNKGYGKQLIQQVIDWANTNNIKSLKVRLYTYNQSLRNLFEKYGFHTMYEESFLQLD